MKTIILTGLVLFACTCGFIAADFDRISHAVAASEDRV